MINFGWKAWDWNGDPEARSAREETVSIEITVSSTQHYSQLISRRHSSAVFKLKKRIEEIIRKIAINVFREKDRQRIRKNEASVSCRHYYLKS